MLGLVAFTATGRRRRRLPDAQPRPLDRRALPPGRACSTSGATRALIADFGGLRRGHARSSPVFLVVSLSSIGLPGLQRLRGRVPDPARRLDRSARGWSSWPRSGSILAAVYMLWMFQRVFFGEVTNPKNRGCRDLSAARGGGARAARRAGDRHGRRRARLHAARSSLGRRAWSRRSGSGRSRSARRDAVRRRGASRGREVRP